MIRRPRYALRTRLTALYGCLFLVAGALLLTTTAFLVQNSLGRQLDRKQAQQAVELRQELARAQSEPGRDAGQVEGKIEQLQQELRDSAARSVLTQGGLALLGVGILAAGSGWLVAGRALRRLRRIQDTAHRIAAEGKTGTALRERIALDGPDDDVKELADSFDLMLERLDRSFDGQSRFVANASHELRTPIAMNRLLLELALTAPGVPNQTVELGTSLLRTNQRQERLIDGLLLLAESEAEALDLRPVELAEIADRVVSAAGTELDLQVDLQPAPAAGDPVLLERLIENLVENAIRYNVPAGGWLRVETRSAGEQAVLVVSNSGPMVPVEQLDELFQPFRRLDGSRDRQGSGLGLSIVRSVARAHGGDAAAEARPDGGLVVEVTLPLRRG